MADVKLSNIANGAENSFETPVFTDTLDPALIKLVDNTVQVDEKEAQYTYDDTTGLLTVNLETIATGVSAKITFQVQKV